MSVGAGEKAKKGRFGAIFGLRAYVVVRNQQLEREFNRP
jgi:hypothetical protein